MSAQAAADALLAAAQVPGGFVVEFAGSTWRVRSPYSREVCGHGSTLEAAVLSYVASREYQDAEVAAMTDKAASSGVTLLTSKAGQ